jgi:hypothetical protein
MRPNLFDPRAVLRPVKAWPGNALQVANQPKIVERPVKSERTVLSAWPGTSTW